MNAKKRIWLLAALGIAVFILGTPLAQRVVAGDSAQAGLAQRTHSHQSDAGHHQVIRLGDTYLRLVATDDGSIHALLYDSSLKLIAVNENETKLDFTLPDGRKQALRFTVPSMSSPGCSMEGCTEDAGHENCDHSQQAGEHEGGSIGDNP